MPIGLVYMGMVPVGMVPVGMVPVGMVLVGMVPVRDGAHGDGVCGDGAYMGWCLLLQVFAIFTCIMIYLCMSILQVCLQAHEVGREQDTLPSCHPATRLRVAWGVAWVLH